MNGTYVVSPNHTGSVHLTVWAYDEPSYTGRSVPLCGQDRGRRWHITGPWAEKWPTYSRYQLCGRCQRVLDMLADEAERMSGLPR